MIFPSLPAILPLASMQRLEPLICSFTDSFPFSGLTLPLPTNSSVISLLGRLAVMCEPEILSWFVCGT